MSSLYPDESYCTTEFGRILFQLKTDWECKSKVQNCGEEKGLTGTYTVYTVEVTCSPVAAPLADLPERRFLVETRYKEMQKLHSALAKLHKQLYLRGTFPHFPSPKFIGSTEPSVIEERKLAIDQLLNFVFDSEVLRKAKVLHDFVEKAKEQVHTAHEISSSDIFYDNSRSILDTPIGELSASDLPALLPAQQQEQQQEQQGEFQFPNVSIAENPLRISTVEKLRKGSMRRLFPRIRGTHLVSTTSSENEEAMTADYLVKAGQLVATAQRAEEEHAYELAFQCYKNAASSLIQGVQLESDIARRNAVRRKTAKYLVKAEKLYRTYLSFDGSVFNFDGLLTAAMEDPNILAFQCSNKSLKNYEFVGVLPCLNAEKRVLLVEDKTTRMKFVMKLLEKGMPKSESDRIFLPSNVPHMVHLVQFFETESHIILLLEHVAPGTLHGFLSRYFEEAETRYLIRLSEKTIEVRDGERISQVLDTTPEGPKYMYRGRKLLFNVGMDFERAVEMRDQTISTEKPPEDSIVCVVGEDPTGRSTAPAGEFSIVGTSKEAIESNLLQGREESPAAIRIEFSKEDRPSCSNQLASFDEKNVVSTSSGDSPEVVEDGTFAKSLASALKAVRQQLELRRKTWNHIDLPECLAIHWSAQIVSFLFVLHTEHGEYLGDITPNNILIDKDGNLVMTYQGRWYGGNNRNRRVTDGYSAPECTEYGWIPTAASDVWTLGAVMFEILCGRSLATAAPHGVCRALELPYPDDCNISFVAKDLLNMILIPTAICRPSLDDIRAHPFFRYIDWRLYDNPTCPPIPKTPSSSTIVEEA